MKKFIAAVMALCIVGGALPSVGGYAPESALTASAEDEEWVTIDRISYTVYSDHAVLEAGFDGIGDVVIPDKINGVPVTSISRDAFYGAEHITSLTLPDTITKIDNNAFSFSSLQNVKMPEKLEEFGYEVFAGCGQLESITMSSGIDLLDTNTFWHCESLTSVTLPDTLQFISSDAFLGCTSLKTITIPESVTQIDGNAFRECDALETVNISEKCKIFNGAFNGCVSLTSFSGPVLLESARAIEDCCALKSLELAVTEKQTTFTDFELKDFAALESLTIPDCYTLKDTFKLNNCGAITRLCLPKETHLSSITLKDCKALSDITFPEKYVRGSVPSLVISGNDSIKTIDLSGEIIKSVTLDNMPQLEEIVLTKNPQVDLRISNCEKLTKLTRSVTDSSVIDYETCPDLKDIYFYDAVSEKGYISDIRNVVENEIVIHLQPSNTVLSDYLSNYDVDLSYFGDANLDGSVNIADAVLVMQVATNPDKYAQGKTELSISANGEINADVDGKAGLSNSDALMIQKFKLGLVESFN